MTYFSNIMGYIEDLCTKHKDLLHNTNGTAFIPMGIDDESAAIISGMKSTYVRINNISLQGRSENELFWSAQVIFLKNLPATAATKTAIENARNLTQQIMFDFDARIRWEHDLQDEDSRCFFITNILEPTMEPVGLVDQSAIGWSYTWRFTTERKNYDATKWQ